jgi:hypothetical protein
MKRRTVAARKRPDSGLERAQRAFLRAGEQGEARMLWHRFGRYIAVTALLLGAMIGLRSAATGQDNFSLNAPSDTGIPELYFYHGMVLDKNLREIPPTVDNVSFVLRRFVEGLAGRSSQDANARLVDMLRNAPIAEMDKNDELLRSAAMARWLLKDANYPRKESLDPMLGALEVWASIPTGEGVDDQLRNNSRLAPVLAAMDLEIEDEAVLRDRQSVITDYLEECKREQVPLPPDWGDSRWMFQSQLDPNFSFVADSNSVAEVWTYVDPNVLGLCIALPRKDVDTEEIGLFGIICQSETTGKACFWDNVDWRTKKRLTPERSKRMKIAEIQNGSLIKENCTNCHRGENVFVIHPRTALDLPDQFDTDPEGDWYTPISKQKIWGNPGPMEGLTKCNGCHQVPELAANNNDLSTKPVEASPYCRILQQVVDKTMPPTGAPAGWEKPQSHKEDVDLLRKKCEALQQSQP